MKYELPNLKLLEFKAATPQIQTGRGNNQKLRDSEPFREALSLDTHVATIVGQNYLITTFNTVMNRNETLCHGLFVL